MSSQFTHSSYFGDGSKRACDGRGPFVRDTPIAIEWHGFRSCTPESLVDVSSGPYWVGSLRDGRARTRPRGREGKPLLRPTSSSRIPHGICSFPDFGPGRVRYSRPLPPSSLLPSLALPQGMARNAPASVPSPFRPGVRWSRDLPASSLPPSLPPSAASRPAGFFFLPPIRPHPLRRRCLSRPLPS